MSQKKKQEKGFLNGGFISVKTDFQPTKKVGVQKEFRRTKG